MNAPKAPWFKRPKFWMASFGAILAASTFFGKEKALDPWKKQAEEIKTAINATASADENADMEASVIEIRTGVRSLLANTLKISNEQQALFNETRKDEEAQAATESILKSSGIRLKALLKLDDICDGCDPSLRLDFHKLQEDHDTIEQILHRSRGLTLARALPKTAPSMGFTPEDVAHPNINPDHLIFEARQVEIRLERLGVSQIKAAQLVRKKDETRVTQAELGIDAVFVVGLFLSLSGKLGGAETEFPEA